MKGVFSTKMQNLLCLEETRDQLLNYRICEFPHTFTGHASGQKGMYFFLGSTSA